jgi:DsbC/DsbD-like thiol-disulfide interchange protein/cytochrome c biogenesis protein CcdA
MSDAMRKRFALLVLALLAPALLLAAPALADAAKVRTALVPDRLSVAPGGTLTVALEQDIAPGWHTYWENPGDAGLATEIRWQLPPGWRAGPIAWPAPEREAVGPLMDYGYRGKVWLLVDLTAPADAKPDGKAEIVALARWLACREVCVPEEADLPLTLFVDRNAPPPNAVDAEAFAAARARLPVPSPWPVVYDSAGGLKLFVAAPALARTVKTADFFPLQTDAIANAAPQRLSAVAGGLVLSLAKGRNFARGKPLTGVLVLRGAGGSPQALAVSAHPGPVPAASGGLGLGAALLFAFLGGLILNVMPCVLPVLAMKALALARGASARGEALVYSFGAVVGFVGFGLLIAALRAAGVAAGWGFQLQEPRVVAFLAILLLAVGLNFSGVFEIAPIGAGETLARKGGRIGAFFTGLLAVAVASPCTAPFMASATGFALTQDPATILVVFAALGLGFALPFLAIGLVPALCRLLPKPGPWMNLFKKILALPMYGAAVWLLWVLLRQVGWNGMLPGIAAAALAASALAVWGAGVGRRRKIVAVCGLVLAALLVWPLRPLPEKAALPPGAQAYSAARLSALRAEHRPVFVDASAAWCITCQLNEEAALSRPQVRAAFRRKGIVFLVADWTGRDPAIGKLLQAHGRAGVPLYLYYAPGAETPEVLPQILTEDAVLQAVGR